MRCSGGRTRDAPGAHTTGSVHLPKRNYGFEKRQKELKRQEKREEKRQRKLERADAPADASSDENEATGEERAE